MTDRTTLALAACAGISDAELAERGNQGYAKMIQRKRKYAQGARMLAVANAHLIKQLAQAKAALEAAQTSSPPWSSSTPPIGDTSLAAGMLASIAASGPTMLIAGLRCLVAARLGPTVDVPQELVP